MKYLLPIVLFTFWGSFNLPAQRLIGGFGEIFRDEIELSKVDYDSLAEAVVLFDYGQTYYNVDETFYAFDMYFERHIRIKILSDAGIDWSTFKIPYWKKYKDRTEVVYGIKAVSYNLKNGVLENTHIDASNVFDEVLNSDYSQKKIVIPNVRKGSIVEIKYGIKSKEPSHIKDWEFQWEIPVLYSEYNVVTIPFYEYTWLLQGANEFTSTSGNIGGVRTFMNINYTEKHNRFAMNRLPAFKDEEYITSKNDYIIKQDFQLAKINYPNGQYLNYITTWSELVNHLRTHDNYGKFIGKSERIANKIFNVDSVKLLKQINKFNFIVDYVKEGYSWNNYTGIYCSKTANKFLKDQDGNCNDINLFLCGLLRSVDINAYTVLMSTRNHGKIKYDYPYSHFFNYSIVAAIINNDTILTDATNFNCKNRRIPITCINDKGLIIDKGKEEWLNLSSDVISEISTELNIELSGNDINADVNNKFTEYEALNQRELYGDNKEKVKKMLEKRNYEIEDSNINIRGLMEKNKPYIMNFRLKISSGQINNKIFFPPFLNETIGVNPLKQVVRNYPIDMIYPKKRTFKSVIEVPKGYVLDHLPENLRIKNDDFELEYKASFENGRVEVLFSYFFKKGIYAPDVYQDLKSYFDEIIKRGNEKLVFVQN